MLTLTLQMHDKADAPLADLPFGLRIRARAWTTDEDRDEAGNLVAATVHVVHGNQHNQVLLAHEAAHALRDQDNDAMHHPWHHFCGLVGHALRTRAHLNARELEAGRLLATEGGCTL